MVLIEGLELPIRYDRRATTLDSITSRFEDLLAAVFEADPEQIRGRAGYRYAAIPAICPECAAGLRFSPLLLDRANGAFAVATCQGSCGWTGAAVYRLIDLVARTEGPIRSAVAGGDLEPSYRSYWS